MRRMVLPLLLGLALVATACSDDDNEKQDSGVTPDMSTVDQQVAGDTGAGDTGPAADAAADQGSKKKVEEYVPKDDEITGWKEDTSAGKAGVEAGYTKAAIEALIDGKHDPYAAKGCNAFAMQQYKKDFGSSCDGTLELMIWECPAAADAKALFDKNKSDGETQSGLTFQDIPNVTDKGIWAYDAVYIAYAYKSVYVMKLDANNSAASCVMGVKDDLIKFVQTITGKLP